MFACFSVSNLSKFISCLGLSLLSLRSLARDSAFSYFSVCRFFVEAFSSFFACSFHTFILFALCCCFFCVRICQIFIQANDDVIEIKIQKSNKSNTSQQERLIWQRTFVHGAMERKANTQIHTKSLKNDTIIIIWSGLGCYETHTTKQTHTHTRYKRLTDGNKRASHFLWS